MLSDDVEGEMDIKIPDELATEVAAIAEQTGQSAADLFAEMVVEALKMRRVPGILFADGPSGRRARIGGTGIDVFEVIDRYERTGKDRDELQRIFHWLSAHQLTAAVEYYEAFPAEISARLRTDDADRESLEALWRKYPQISPNWPGRRVVEQKPATPAIRDLA